MSKGLKFLAIILALGFIFNSGVAQAAVRAKKVCAGVPFANDLESCWVFEGGTCTVGVRGAFLDLTDQVSITSSRPDGNVTIVDKGVDAGFGCVPTMLGTREGFVILKISNMDATGTMTIRMLRPNLLGGRDFDDISVDVKKGTFLKVATFNATAGEPKEFVLEGGGMTLLKLIAPDENNEIISKTGTTARVKMTFPNTGTINLNTKLDFLVSATTLNDANGWPTVTVRAATIAAAPGMNIAINGGQGTVTSVPAGINCPGDCNSQFAPNTNVLLTATVPANVSARFIGWAGDCLAAGINPQCTINSTTRPNASATARFINTTKLTVTVNGVAGAGTVTSNVSPSAPVQISCPNICVNDYSDTNASVTLTATPAPGHRFEGWSLTTCSDTVATCTFPIGVADRVITATFQ
jgi:hypothetical protein